MPPVLDAGHVLVKSQGGFRVVAMPSAYYVSETNRDTDVVLHGSFMGVWPARFMASHGPRAIVGVDCGIGKDAAGIAGLWYLEALGIPGIAADVRSVELLDGGDVYRRGIVSRANYLAGDCGIAEGMPVAEAVDRLLAWVPAEVEPHQRIERTVMREHPSGRKVVCIHSIAFPSPEDKNQNVLCTGGFAGPPNIVKASPYGFICSDGGRGLNDSGLAGLECGIPGATVDVQTARIGDGLSTYREGVISACNRLAEARGVRVGQTAREAAWLLVSG